MSVCSRGLMATSDPTDLKSRSNLGREATLCATQDDVKKLLTRRYRLDFLPGGLHAEPGEVEMSRSGGQRMGGG